MTAKTYTTKVAFTKWNAKIANLNTYDKQVGTLEPDTKNTYKQSEQTNQIPHLRHTTHTHTAL
jgi:hypothetical protein